MKKEKDLEPYVKSGKLDPKAALEFLRAAQEGFRAIQADALATAGNLPRSQSRHYKGVMGLGISLGDMAQKLERTCFEINYLKSVTGLL